MKTRIALIAVCLLLCACSLNIVRGSGKLTTEAREARGIDRLALPSSGDVILTQGDRESLTVETDANVMQYITTKVDGGTLTLGTQNGMSVSPTRLTFTLTVVDLDGITVSGSGNVDAERFDTDDLEVKVTGSGNARIDALAAQTAQVRVTGSGNVDLAGQVAELEVNNTGSGNYVGGDLRSERASVTNTGSGNVTLWATESLDARVTGSGTVRYYGDPTTNVSDSGSGEVKRLGSK
jgi:hypothetical protein